MKCSLNLTVNRGKTSAGNGRTTSRHLQALLPSMAALSQSVTMALAAHVGLMWVRTF